MIFTRRFGALAARPTFPSVTEVELQEEIDELLQSADRQEVADEHAS